MFLEVISKLTQYALKLLSASSPDSIPNMDEIAIIEKIKLITNSDNVKLVINIDSNLIGGFIVKIGSKVIDASLSGKLNQIAFYLNTN